MNFKLEHKIERCFLKCSYIQKAHYAMLIYSPVTSQFNEELVVIRGLEKKRDKLKYVNPVYFILIQMLRNNSQKKDLVVLQNNGIYEHRVVVKLRSWRDSLQFTKTRAKSSLGKNVMPGDFLIVYRLYRLNNLYFPINYYQQYKSRSRRSLRINTKQKTLIYKNISIKNRQSLFEKYLSTKGIRRTIILMKADNLTEK
jgi:hypothetical protein